jgi:hypothetical protein
MGVLEGLRPLEDVMERTGIYVVLRDFMGYPELSQASMMRLKV